MSKKIALVIGIRKYTRCSSLKNAVNDAALISRRLQRLGYRVFGGASSEACQTGLTEGMDLGFEKANLLLSNFMDAITPGATVVIYYAGHGEQEGDENYLVCADAPDKRLPNRGRIPIKTRLGTIAAKAGRDGTVVLFLDACRSASTPQASLTATGDVHGTEDEGTAMQAAVQAVNPAEAVGTRGPMRAFKIERTEQNAQTFIGFATAPGDVAEDGAGGNSTYARALDRHLGVRGLEVMELFDRVSRDVLDRTAGLQSPWKETNLNRQFFVHPRTPWPFFALGAGGLLAGLLICYLLFDKGRLLTPIPLHYWGLGLLFGVVAATGTIVWGSGWKPRDVAFALMGPGIGFALALAILQIVPHFAWELKEAPPMVPRDFASKLYWTVTIVGGLLYIIGTISVRAERKQPWPQTALGWFNWALTWSLPVIIVVVLLKIQTYMAAAASNPLWTAIAMFALLGGLIYATSVALACRAQGGNFAQFGPFTGAITVGLLMSAFYGAFTAFGVRRDILPEEAHWLMVILGAAWHGLLGAQLGYCFTYYVPDYRKPSLDSEPST